MPNNPPTGWTPEPWTESIDPMDTGTRVQIVERKTGNTLAIAKDYHHSSRIVACVNALAGVADPEAAIKALSDLAHHVADANVAPGHVAYRTKESLAEEARRALSALSSAPAPRPADQTRSGFDVAVSQEAVQMAREALHTVLYGERWYTLDEGGARPVLAQITLGDAAEIMQNGGHGVFSSADIAERDDAEQLAPDDPLVLARRALEALGGGK